MTDINLVEEQEPVFAKPEVFKCINIKCRNVAHIERSLCQFCAISPYGYTADELAPYKDLPFDEIQRLLKPAKDRLIEELNNPYKRAPEIILPYN